MRRSAMLSVPTRLLSKADGLAPTRDSGRAGRICEGSTDLLPGTLNPLKRVGERARLVGPGGRAETKLTVFELRTLRGRLPSHPARTHRAHCAPRPFTKVPDFVKGKATLPQCHKQSLSAPTRVEREKLSPPSRSPPVLPMLAPVVFSSISIPRDIRPSGSASTRMSRR